MEPLIYYLFSNIPALGVGPLKDDMVRLNPKDILFAACGDLRDSVTLVNALRENQAKTGASVEPINIVLNDMVPYVQLRNLLILMFPGGGEVRSAIELWYYPIYSEKTQKLIRRVLLDYCPELFREAIQLSPETDKIADIYNIEFRLNSGTMVRCSMQKLFYLILVLNWMGGQPTWGTDGTKTAAENRRKVTENPTRKDWLQRSLYGMRPGWRNSIDRYQEDGIVAPYHDHKLRATLTKPNV